MSRSDQINELVSDLQVDLEKFYDKGNKTAGTRARKKLQELKKLAQDIRVEIQERKG